jgi:hypothetical protein
MNKYQYIQCDTYTCNDKEDKYNVEAFKTNDKNEMANVIAKIDMMKKTVEYLDEDAKTDEYAQAIINEMLENGYVLTE